jgi:hypothetical protein
MTAAPPPSRQVRWQRKKLLAGLCSICGRLPLTQSSTGRLSIFCLSCLLKQREKNAAQARKRGFRAWRKGGPGRPPLEVGR